MSQIHSQSPPPLRHPVPTHPAYIPEPPPTPSSPQGYQRFSSSPAPGGQPAPKNHPNPSGYPAHVPAYGVPYPQAPLQGHMYNHDPSQHGGAAGGPGIPPPNFAAWGIDGATAQLGMQLGSSAVAAGQEYMQKNFGTFFPSMAIKHHFNVSNSYVIRKIQLVLFPWIHKPWSRGLKRTEQGGHEWQPPRDDINSPDLYIPVMAVVTYILLSGLNAGFNNTFRPQILGESASRAILVTLFDFLFIKLGCYILNIQGPNQFGDILAFTGYKFVGVILTVTAGFLGLKGPLWMIVFIYAFLANAFFLLRSLRSVVLPDPSISISGNPNPTTITVSPAQRRRRITLLFLVAVLQIVYMGALVRLPTI